MALLKNNHLKYKLTPAKPLLLFVKTKNVEKLLKWIQKMKDTRLDNRFNLP